MSDGRNWYPGSDDPRYDPYAQPQAPQGPPPQQRRQPYPQQPQQPQGGQSAQGYRPPGQQGQPGQAPGRGQAPSRYDRPGDPYAPPPRRAQQPPQQQRPSRHDAPADPYAPPPRRQSADVWQAPDGRGEPQDEPPARRRRSGAGSGPGRQTDGPSGPGHVNADVDLDDLDPDGRAQRGWEREKSRVKRPQTRARQATKWGIISLTLVILAGAGFGGYVYMTTFGTIKSTPLTPDNFTQAPLIPDKYGNTPLNILLIGSDTRDTAGDCSLGSDCGAGANADSEMVLHISAERNNATILSIPRDTMAMLPNCAQDKSGKTTVTGTHSTYQINSALQKGPECQVAAVSYLTGIHLTGYIMFDFSGIVTMSDALGGVPVCVTHAVNDKNSGLQLPAGTSVVKGKQALQFLRTRDSFFDGSDLGREMATHYFLSQMIASLRKSMNFTNISTLINIGQAAAKATTISTSLAGLTNLESLIQSLNKVPSKNIAMMTMPNQVEGSRVVPTASAQGVFKSIENDVSFTNTSTKASSGSTPTPTTAATSAPDTSSVAKSQVPVHVYNADGVAGRAGTITSALTSAGFSQAASKGNAQEVSASLVYYAETGEKLGAEAVAETLGLPMSQVQQNSSFPGVSVFIGTDFESGSKFKPLINVTSTEPKADTSGAASAPAEASESFATDSSTECIPWFSGSGGGTLKIVQE
ncbi:LCP family protein [Actinospica robiniae]|uniref:LCP family protein n=1 Tax=Actinospica robiniae TaxID=304901 RepID=UPI000429B09F|nr:LCP family protein [Actinospica robiniae]